ncbi:MAG: InlB B-repeat-containing protein, partial [Blautia sp.]|nr:InlB B-repeat-containing protein [Blautia sp.]
MKSNKYLPLLLIIFLSFFGQLSMKAQNIVFKANDANATAGSTVNINVNLDASVPIFSVKFTIALPEGMTFVASSSDAELYGSISSARKPSNCMQKDILVAPNKVTFGLVSTTRIKQDSGTLVTFRAKLPSNLTLGSYPIEISNVEATSETSDLSDKVTIQTGKVNVVKPTYTINAVAGAHGAVTVSPTSTTGTYEEGTQLTLTATPDQGYLFNGWSSGSKDNPLKVTVTSNATYTANFTPQIFKVTFMIDGKSIVKDVPFGSSIPVPTVDSKTGYTFTGWDTTVPTTMPAKDLTFTAQWKVNTYKLIFNTGTQVISNDVAYGASVAAPTVSARDGYVFEGWDESIPTTMPAKDLTFNARWRVILYQLSYIVDDITMLYQIPCDATIALPATLTRTGYTFA